MENEYKENDQYAQIGRELIENEDVFEMLKKHNPRIAFLESNKPAPKSGRFALGMCKKMSDKDKSLLAAGVAAKGTIPDFFIIIYKERIKHFTPRQLRILIMHELMHVGVEEKKDGSAVFSSKKHDVEDFRMIIDRFGVDWDGDGQITWQNLLEDPDLKQDKSSEVAQRCSNTK